LRSENEELSEEQKEAITFIDAALGENLNPVCALDTGMGKTWVACEIIRKVIECEEKCKEERKVLIIHTASLYKDPWRRTLSDCGLIGKDDDSVYLHGKNRLGNILPNTKRYFFKKSSVFLTTYDTAAIDMNKGYYDPSDPFDLVIFDELHRIINSKRLTQKSIVLASLPAKHKLGLTATPIQNNDTDLAVMFLFLNEPSALSKPESRCLSPDILKKGLDLYIKSKFLFHRKKRHRDYEKKAMIISIPIDEKMLMFFRNELSNKRQKKLMFLSHPDSVSYNYGKREDESIPCNKAEAVKIILQSMAYDEKLIIFSLYIDVLNAYYKLCKQMGFSAIKITGEEKGNRLTAKLNQFKYSEKSRILLTTLQKSAEGLNFDIANHVIILELWWNPQKIFQAMSRIDRINQRRNIFIYLLCYHEKGEKTLLAEENDVLETMRKKFNSAQNTYKSNNSQPEKDTEKKYVNFSLFEELLPVKFIGNTDFKAELQTYLQTFTHTSSINKNNLVKMENHGQSFIDISDNVVEDLKIRNEYFHILFQYPWRIVLPDIKRYLYYYFLEKINGKEGHNLRNSIVSVNNIPLLPDPVNPFYHLHQLESYDKKYHHLFIKKTIIHTKLAGIPRAIALLYIIGKQRNGKLDLIVLERSSSTFPFLKMLLDNKKEILKGGSSITISGYIQDVLVIHDLLLRNDKSYRCQLCLSCLFSTVFRDIFSDQTMPLVDIEKLFLESTITEARNTYDFIMATPIWQKYNNTLLDIRKGFFCISSLYNYNLQDRVIIGTTNIIDYIAAILKILVADMNFISINQLENYITIASHQILEYGDDFIPNWKQLTQKIDVR